MSKLKMHSVNRVQSNLDQLAKLFPECTAEAHDEKGHVTRKIDFDLLRQELSDHIVEGQQERYQLNWPGKRESLLAANAPVARTFRPQRRDSLSFDTTRNLLIEGDNLEALKLLQESYLNKVKLIYIDPPYNTGNDFVYDDDFSMDAEDYLLRSEQQSSAGERLVANTEANGRFHSDWMSMMYSRLRLSRNLLTDDGAILISVDDNEIANLRRLCDEVFGDGNFAGQIVWQRSKKGDAKLIAKVHEYVVCYVRDKAKAVAAGPWRKTKEGVGDVLRTYQQFRSALKDNHEAIRAAMQKFYRELPDDDPRKAHQHYSWSDERGLYFPDNFAGPDDGRASRPRYDIIHPITGKPCKKPSTGWRWDEAKTKWALAEKPPRIHFGPDETTIPNRKSYLSDNTDEPFHSVFYRDGRSATLEVEGLIGKGWFQFPKNTEVLAELIGLTTKPDDVVLDFFAGSGSTGHAVWKLAETTGNRRFILVQCAEPVEKPGEFSTIADICKARLQRASQKMQAAAGLNVAKVDYGFRYLRVDSSNLKDVYYTPDAVHQATLAGLVDNVKDDRTDEDLLFQVLVDWGVDLTLPIKAEKLGKKTVYFVDGDALAACFDAGINESFIKELARRRPLRAVFRDNGYGSDATKINVEQVFKLLSPGTDVKSI